MALPGDFPRISPSITSLPARPETPDPERMLGYLQGCFEAVHDNLCGLDRKVDKINGTGRKNAEDVAALQATCRARGEQCGKSGGVTISYRHALMICGAVLVLVLIGIARDPKAIAAFLKAIV